MEEITDGFALLLGSPSYLSVISLAESGGVRFITSNRYFCLYSCKTVLLLMGVCRVLKNDDYIRDYNAKRIPLS